MKKVMCFLLALLLLLSAVPAQAHQVETMPAVGPTLAEGNHALYLDRLQGLPQYALELYQWLRDNATAEGALADPSLATEDDGEYYHIVTNLSGSESFAVTNLTTLYETARARAIAGLQELQDGFRANAGAAFNAFDRDCPEVFWLSGQSSYGYLGSWYYSLTGNVCTVTYQADMVFYLQSPGFDIRASGYRTPEAVAAAIAERDGAVERILSGCSADTPWEQIRYLNETLTQINAYNRAGAEGRWWQADPDAWKCISALKGCTGDEGPVCEGYARAFKVLCDRLGIPCVLVSGRARTGLWSQSVDHMWADVCLEGSWYAVDVTWNDPYVAHDPVSARSGFETEEYLALGSDTEVDPGLTFLQSRQIQNNVSPDGPWFTNGPVLSSAAYEPGEARFSLSGTVTALSKYDDPLTVLLWEESSGALLQEQIPAEGTYCFESLIPGDYRLTFCMPNHTGQSRSVSLTEDTTLPEVALQLVGDVSGDGRINVGDVSMVYAHAKKTAVLEDYTFLVADVNGDLRITVGDVSKVYAHAKKTGSLW